MVNISEVTPTSHLEIRPITNNLAANPSVKMVNKSGAIRTSPPPKLSSVNSSVWNLVEKSPPDLSYTQS